MLSFEAARGFFIARILMSAVLDTPRLERLHPDDGEAQVDFVDRVWDQIPADSDIEKAKICRDAWLSSGRDSSLQRIAAKRFPADRFQRVTGSAVFKEHETVRYRRDPVTGEESDEQVVYDRDAIAAICEQCNSRIQSTEDFAPLVEGHTPTRQQIERGARQPDVLGYAGPFYVGKLGGKFAIFADEYHHKQDQPRLDRLQRRSPEVWMKDISGNELTVDQRFFDPIACLGAETPRLDLGMTRYGRDCFETIGHDGAQLMKYAAPAANSVYVPTDIDDEPDKYSGTEPMPLSDQDLQQIVEAVSSMRQFQILEELEPALPRLLEMAGGNGGGDIGGDHPAVPDDDQEEGEPDDLQEQYPDDDPAGDIPDEPVSGAAEGTEDEAQQPDSGGDYSPDDDDQEMLSRYMSGGCDDQEFMRYMSGKRSRLQPSQNAPADNNPPPAGDQRDNYSRRDAMDKDRYAREIAHERRKNAEMEKRLAAIEADKREAQRYSRLSDARQQHAFDIDEQLEFTRDMSDDQFDRYMLSAVPNFSPIPLGEHVPVLPTPDIDRGRAKQSEDYRRQKSEWVANEVEKRRGKGLAASWEEVAAEYDAQQQ